MGDTGGVTEPPQAAGPPADEPRGSQGGSPAAQSGAQQSSSRAVQPAASQRMPVAGRSAGSLGASPTEGPAGRHAGWPAGAPAGESSPQRWYARTWWQVVGVVLTALGVVVAVLQLIATPDAPTPVGGGDSVPSAAVSSVQQPSSIPPSASSPPPAAGVVRWQGRISFAEAFDISTDLDLMPPRPTQADGDGDIHAGGTSGMLETEGWVTDYDGSSLIAEWDEGGKPDFTACRERALSSGSNEVREVRKGTSLCVRNQ